MFAASVVAKRGAEHQVAYIGLPLPKKDANGNVIKPKAKGKAAGGKYTPAEIFEKTKSVTKGVLWFDTGLLMPSKTTKNIEKFRTILLSWDNPMTTPTMGRILRGPSDPTNVNDKRNNHEGTACIFEVRQDDLGTLGEAIGYIDRDFEAGIEEFAKQGWKWPADAKTTYRNLVTTSFVKTVEGVETVEEVQPRISFMALVDETWSATSYPTNFRGRAKTVILDYNKPIETVDPKTGKKTVKYEPFTIEDADGNSHAIDATNRHLALPYGYRIRRLEWFMDKVSQSDSGGRSPHSLAHTVVVEAISSEMEYVEDEDDTGTPDAALAAAVAADEEAPDDEIQVVDEHVPEPEPAPESVPEPVAKAPVATKSAPAASSAKPAAATVTKPTAVAAKPAAATAKFTAPAKPAAAAAKKPAAAKAADTSDM